jgi:hypothetical protein
MRRRRYRGGGLNDAAGVTDTAGGEDGLCAAGIYVVMGPAVVAIPCWWAGVQPVAGRVRVICIRAGHMCHACPVPLECVYKTGVSGMLWSLPPAALKSVQPSIHVQCCPSQAPPPPSSSLRPATRCCPRPSRSSR